MRSRLWILGAPDPEMERIEQLLHEAGEEVAYALGPDGQRVHPGNAYQFVRRSVDLDTGIVYLVECDGIRPERADVVIIDHHRLGDPGYGRPPEEFLAASSIGQVIAELAWLGFDQGNIAHRYFAEWATADELGLYKGILPGQFLYVPRIGWLLGTAAGGTWRYVVVPPDVIFVAAADHCLAAAYRGECPGVDPDALMRWRVEIRARFQGRSVEEVLADIERARVALREAPQIPLTAAGSMPVADLRAQNIPELPEAAAREGIAFLATVLERDGRRKVVLQAATSDQVSAFKYCWAPAQGLVGIYGDPERGFAGGYVPEESTK